MSLRLDYSPLLLMREVKNRKLFIYTYEINTRIKRHILTVPKSSRIDILDSKTALIAFITEIRIVDIESKEVLQILELDQSRKEQKDRLDRSYIVGINYSPHILFSEIERKPIKHILISFIVNHNYMIKLYKYEDRKLITTGFEIEKDVSTNFFSGDKYLIGLRDEFKVQNLKDMKTLQIALKDDDATLLQTSYNTLLVGYVNREEGEEIEGEEIIEEVFFEEIDPESGKILRKIEPHIHNVKEYLVFKDHDNEGEYIIPFHSMRFDGSIYLFIYTSFDNKIYSVHYISDKVKLKENRIISQPEQDEGLILDFQYLENGNLLLDIFEQKKDKSYGVLYNIKSKKTQIIKKTKTELCISIPISKDKILYGDSRVIDVNKGCSYRLSSKAIVIPFILQTEKNRMRSKVVRLIKDNFIPIDIKRIIARFI